MSTQLSLQLTGDIRLPAVSFTPGTGTGLAVVNEEVLPANTITRFNVAFPVTSRLQLVVIKSSVDAQLQVNSQSGLPGTGALVIVLEAGIPALWYDGCGYTIAEFLGGSDVTDFYVANNGATAGTLFVGAQYDPTP